MHQTFASDNLPPDAEVALRHALHHAMVREFSREHRHTRRRPHAGPAEDTDRDIPAHPVIFRRGDDLRDVA